MSTPVPPLLQTIPNPPKQLFTTGVEIGKILSYPRIAIVGSRKVSTYGKQVTKQLAYELAKQGIVIISGLAYGVDMIAHTAALDAGGLTVAVLPTGLDKIYPAAHRQLATRIQAHGMLVTEYPNGTKSFKGNFIARNRLVSGLSDAVLITEAAENSGTLHTARFAIEQGKKLLAVPGNITSPTSAGTNQLIKTGAIVVTCANDVLNALGITTTPQKKTKPTSTDPHEQTILDLLFDGVTDGNTLLQASGLSLQAFHHAMTMLEISGTIQPLGNDQWKLHEY